MACGKLTLLPSERLLLWRILVLSVLLLLTVACEEFRPYPLVPGTIAYRWFLLFLVYWERTGRGILSLNTSTINSLNVPRANSGTWQIYSFNGKMHSLPPVPSLHCKIKTDIRVNF